MDWLIDQLLPSCDFRTRYTRRDVTPVIAARAPGTPAGARPGARRAAAKAGGRRG